MKRRALRRLRLAVAAMLRARGMSCEIFKYGRSGFNNYLSFQLDERRTAPAAATLAGPHMGAQNRFPL